MLYIGYDQWVIIAGMATLYTVLSGDTNSFTAYCKVRVTSTVFRYVGIVPEYVSDHVEDENRGALRPDLA